MDSERKGLSLRLQNSLDFSSENSNLRFSREFLDFILFLSALIFHFNFIYLKEATSSRQPIKRSFTEKKDNNHLIKIPHWCQIKVKPPEGKISKSLLNVTLCTTSASDHQQAKSYITLNILISFQVRSFSRQRSLKLCHKKIFMCQR